MQAIEELIRLAMDLDADSKRVEAMGLTDDDFAFYDALATNDSTVQAMRDAELKVIAAELISQVKKSVTMDWTLRESARVRIKVMVKCILNRRGYPPDIQEEAVKIVLVQAAGEGVSAVAHRYFSGPPIPPLPSVRQREGWR